MNIITSKNNQKIKDLIKLRDDSKYSESKSLFYVEGERIVNDTPSDLIAELYVLDKKCEPYKCIIDKIDESKIFVLNNEVYDKVKDTKNSQGIIAIVKYKIKNKISEYDFKNFQNCVVLDSINDPGNLGTIIRLSEACNISLVIISSDSCSIFNTKVIRSCMSSIFRTNIYISYDLINDIKYLKSLNYNIYSTVLDNSSLSYSEIDYSKKNVVIFGNEANGIKKEIIDISDKKIYIPMCGKIESLNVSVAASAIFYENMRQNSFYET